MQEIKNTLKELNITEQKLAEMVGVSPTTINRLLRRTPKTVETLQKIRLLLEHKSGKKIDVLGYPNSFKNTELNIEIPSEENGNLEAKNENPMYL
jgi:transcriptional regulator with XRE-family HTH domain